MNKMAKLIIFCVLAVCVLRTYGLQSESMTPLDEVLATGTVPGYPAELAIDGNKETCTYLKPRKPRWWRIVLGNRQKVLSVAVTRIPQDKNVKFTVYVIKTWEHMASYKRCASFTGKFDTPTVVLSCDEGKGIEGEKIHIEDHLQTEEEFFEICEVEVQVGKAIICDEHELEDLENGFIKLNNDSVPALEGTIALHQCDPGYMLIGDFTRTCLEDLSWSGKHPQCIAIVCDELEDLENGFIKLNDSVPALEGTIAIHLCEPGYMLIGDFARTCLKNGTWSGKHPQCRVQMPEAAELHDDEQNLQSQIKELQKNMTDIWTYIYDLKNAVSGHLKHLRVHQMELESSVHRMEHLHEGIGDSSSCDSSHSDSHHHGDDYSHDGDHSHSSDHSHDGNHSHYEDHSHSEDCSHSQNEHSHLSDHQPHSDDHSDHQTHSNNHSHVSHHDHHSYGDQSHNEHGSDHHGQHSYDSDPDNLTHSESHSHSSHDHSKDDRSSDHQQHKDSHETEDSSQHTQKVGSDPRPVAEPVVVATNINRQDGHGHHGHHTRMHDHHSSRNNEMDLMDNFHHHHHHNGYHHGQHDMSKKKNKTMELPTSADYNLFYFATCSIQPNKALPEDEQQNVRGYVNFWQKKSGGPLNIHVNVQGFEMGDHHRGHGELKQVGHHMQNLNQYDQNSENNSSAYSDHGNSRPKSHKHGFTVHEQGDLKNGCENTGLHYNPKNANHGGLMERHVGDLGNIECDEHGVANLLFSDDVASLSGLYSIVGKSLVIHGGEDDLGKEGNPESLISGNSGTKIACCLIQKVDKLQLRYYKAMKTAKHYNNQ